MVKIILILFLFFLPIAFLLLKIILEKKRSRGILKKSLGMKLFLVTVSLEETEEEKAAPLEEQLKNAEQFLNSLSGIKEKGFIPRILFGNPYFVFEIAVPRLGEEIHFYIASPYSISQLIEKQILAFWPKAQVQKTNDYNIFNPSGVSLGSEAYLAKSPIIPLKSYQEFKTDPLSSITNILTKLKKEGEGASVQFIVRKSKESIRIKSHKTIQLIKEGASIDSALSRTKKGFWGDIFEVFEEILSPKKSDKSKKENQAPSSPSQEEEQIISAISNKSSKHLFDVNLRLAASAGTQEKAKNILEQLKSSFDQFNSPVLNSFSFRDLSGKKLKKLLYQYSFRIFSERKKILLSSEELAGVFHLPAPGLLTPHLKGTKTKQAPPPTNLAKEGIVLGKNVFRGEERKILISTEDRLRHFYIIGQTGTGKSSLLQEMIRQDIENNEGVALIDPHGELAEKALSLVPESRINDVIYFNPGDAEYPIALNMMEYDPRYPESKTFVVNELLEIFEKLYNLKAQGFSGPMFEQYMRNALLLVMEDPDSGNTLIEVPKVLADTEFRKYKLSRCKNIIVKDFWEKEAEKAGGEAALANMVPYITSKLNVFIANDLVRPIISQPKSAFNFRDLMDNKKILIVNLSKGRLGEINSYLLGMIIVGKILMAAFSRIELPEEQRKNFFLYIDEFHNVTTKTVSTVLAEARKYRLAMIFSHQFIGQLDEETQKAIFGNVGSLLAFRTGPDDAKYLVSEFGPVFTENDLINLDNYNAALRLLIKGETSRPFNIITYPPKEGDPKKIDLIVKLNRAKYARKRDEVERELYERLKG